MREEPLGYRLLVLSKRYKCVYLKELGDLDIDRFQYILVLIEEHGEELTQKDLAKLLGFDKSYVVNIVDYLANNGYVIRDKNPLDKRCRQIKLTEKAKAALPAIKDAIEVVNELSIAGISDEQITIFKDVLNQIQLNLSKSLPSAEEIPTKKQK